MITIINYNVGNLGSISNMLNYLGIPNKIGTNIDDIINATKLILPGVGSFDYGMKQLRQSGIKDHLEHKVNLMQTPILGICLGMQLMCKSSDEGEQTGLGWFDASVEKFDLKKMDRDRSVPHTGWNGVSVTNSHWVSDDLPSDLRFYFVHSYHTVCNQKSDEWMTSTYGYPFASAIAKENKIAVQFHPEKSHKFGLAILKRFAEWNYVQK